MQDYRNQHVGQVHVRCFFEIAAKNGFEAPEEMAPLTDAEKASLVTIRTGLPDAAALMAAEAQALLANFPQGGDDDASCRAVEKYANDHPTELEKHFDLLHRYLAHRLTQAHLEGGTETMGDMRHHFLDSCFGLHPKLTPEERSKLGALGTTLGDLLLRIFYSLRDFIIDDRCDNLTWIEDRAQELTDRRAQEAADQGLAPDDPVSPVSVYAALVRHRSGAKRLARLRLFSLEEIRCDAMEKSEAVHASHRELDPRESLVASRYHTLFGLLYNFQALEPTEKMEPLGDFLAHGAFMCDATLLQGQAP